MATQESTPQVVSSADPDKIDGALVRLALVLLAGVVVVQLDATIVSVALDRLGRAFDVDIPTVQWVTTAYLLALAMVIPVSGWAVSRFGGRRMWLLALALFLVGSALCGVAWSVDSLIAFRVVQGLGGGLLLPVMQTILAQAAGPRRLGRLMAVVSVPALLTPVLGPVLGGLIIGSLNWRWIFLINVPVCVVAFVLAWCTMPEAATTTRQRFDSVGFALLSPGLAAVVYGFAEAGRHGGFSSVTVIVPLIIGVALLLAFGGYALRTRIVPLIDLRMFRSASFSGSAGLMFLFGISLFGGLFLLPLYEQQARGRSPIEAGLLLAPQGLGMMIGMITLGRIVDRTGPRRIVLIGVALSVLGSVAYTQVTPHTSEILLGASLVVRGLGLAAAMVPVMSTAYVGLSTAEIPRATSAVRIFQQVGASLGTAMLSVVLATVLRNAAHGGHPVDAAATAHAYAVSFWWTLGFSIVAVPLAFLLPRDSAAAQLSAEPAEPVRSDAPVAPAVAVPAELAGETDG
ncbi:MFS transporter, DHA2 family, multidrug resistance protein [Frankia sp. AiPs1]|uniref:DHA2 family efflux MFS transporter permease subunit n=1 Tax=Frankia sp. AiPa1 TaxID=573492 RepID=UPI00202B14F0|nr:DHA2 family efflux MFS transporter permease subunit [Frankia sp. AiPa1]MCL9761768.1 DHA2 family efflux MFS transporter permease subunit [Frankia sp. AiPa1]